MIRARGVVLVAFVSCSSLLGAWNNGPSGNTTTTTIAECSNPPYATHDWVAEHAMDLLPVAERAWLTPHKNLYLIGTEAPDHKGFLTSCGAPNIGYDDRRLGHSVEWNAGATTMTKDRAAVRAQEEYNKAVVAFGQGKPAHAAYFLGAMAHYIGDVSQFGHSMPGEVNHGNYESWTATRTKQFNSGVFESFLNLDSLVKRTAFTAVKRISHDTFAGKGNILSGSQMDSLFATKPQNFIDSVGASLNLGVNELADVLHTFFVNVVDEGSFAAPSLFSRPRSW